MNREQELEALLASARGVRKHPPRFVWILALLIGGACIGGFVMIMVAHPAAPSTAPVVTTPAKPPAPTNDGFVTGAIIGLAVGVIVGMGLQAMRSAKAAARHARLAHSDASTP